MRKKLVLLSGVALIALLVSLVGATAVFAQEPPPEAEAPQGRGMRGRGGFGRGIFGMAHGGQWTVFDAAAEALGFTPEELFAELHGGKSLDEVAEAQGVDIEVVQEAVDLTGMTKVPVVDAQPYSPTTVPVTSPEPSRSTWGWSVCGTSSPLHTIPRPMVSARDITGRSRAS